MSGEGRARGVGRARLVSALSGWTLAACGGLSLAVSAALLSWLGVVVGAAVLAHGVAELRLRRRLLEPGGARAARWMGWNQIALAATISLYAGWQYAQFDAEALADALRGDLIRQLSALYGMDVEAALSEQAPRFVAGFYLAVAMAAWLGCFPTALCYWNAEQRLRERAPEASSLGRGPG